MPYMYILECADGSYYTGSTWNLEKRLWEHQNGLGANYTAKHLPVKLVYCEEGDSIAAAYQREKQIQGWSRKKKQALIAGNTNALHLFTQCQNDSHYRNAPFESGSRECGRTAQYKPSLDSAQPPMSARRSLSGVEGSGADANAPTLNDDSRTTIPESFGYAQTGTDGKEWTRAGIKNLETLLSQH